MMAKLGTSLKREGQHKSHLPKTKNNMVGGGGGGERERERDRGREREKLLVRLFGLG